MHYALTILDKSNGTQSDAGPINAGDSDNRADLLDALMGAWHNGAETLVANGEDPSAVENGFARLNGDIIRWSRGLSAPGWAIARDVVPGYALRVDTHDDDTCDCEI